MLWGVLYTVAAVRARVVWGGGCLPEGPTGKSFFQIPPRPGFTGSWEALLQAPQKILVRLLIECSNLCSLLGKVLEPQTPSRCVYPYNGSAHPTIMYPSSVQLYPLTQYHTHSPQRRVIHSDPYSPLIHSPNYIQS